MEVNGIDPSVSTFRIQTGFLPDLRVWETQREGKLLVSPTDPFPSNSTQSRTKSDEFSEVETWAIFGNLNNVRTDVLCSMSPL